MRVLQLVGFLALLAVLLSAALSGLRRGKIRLRGEALITRSGNPMMFWASIAASLFFVVVLVIAYTFSFSHPMFAK